MLPVSGSCPCHLYYQFLVPFVIRQPCTYAKNTISDSLLTYRCYLLLSALYRLWMRDLFSQCLYIRVLSRSGMSICTHLHSFALMCMLRNSCVMCTDDGGRGKRRTVLLDNGGCGGQRCWSSKMYMFCGVKSWMQPTVGDTGKEKATKSMYKRSQEGKKRTRESAKEKSTLRRVFTSHAGINYTHFHVRFNRSPFWARTIKIICDTCSTWPTNAHIRTCTARHEASCACVLLVIASFLGSPTPELWRWEECGIVISKKPEQKGNSFVLFLVYMTPTVT